MYTIKVVMNDNKEFYLRDLNQNDIIEVFANAYGDILNLNEKVRFTNDFCVEALDLQYFCIE